jgi:hypothetical protein
MLSIILTRSDLIIYVFFSSTAQVFITETHCTCAMLGRIGMPVTLVTYFCPGFSIVLFFYPIVLFLNVFL